jgi:hypothetical protein
MKKIILLNTLLISYIYADTTASAPIAKSSASSSVITKYSDPKSTVIANKSNTSFLGSVISSTSMPVYKPVNYKEALDLDEWIVNSDTGMTITNNSSNDVTINSLTLSVDGQQCGVANVKLIVKAKKQESSFFFTRDKIIKCGSHLSEIFKNLGGNYRLIDVDSSIRADKFLQSQNGLFLYPIKITVNYTDSVGQGSFIHNTFVVYRRD